MDYSKSCADNRAVIDRAGGGVSVWCSFLIDGSYDCTVFPATGLTASLGPFQIIMDMSNVWSDTDDLLADQMRTGKDVMACGEAPFALQIHFLSIVQT